MSSTTWTPPGWRIEEGTPDPRSGWRSVIFHCLAEGCSHTIYTGLPGGVETERMPGLKGHQDQHRPERALDIEVDWILSAECSVCPDEIGKLEEDGDGGVICRECQTTWDRDGTFGHRDGY